MVAFSARQAIQPQPSTARRDASFRAQKLLRVFSTRFCIHPSHTLHIAFQPIPPHIHFGFFMHCLEIWLFYYIEGYTCRVCSLITRCGKYNRDFSRDFTHTNKTSHLIHDSSRR